VLGLNGIYFNGLFCAITMLRETWMGGREKEGERDKKI
jgi:hypothetical protein